MDAGSPDRMIAALERTIEKPGRAGADERLLVGVDLGTAYIVVVVLNQAQEPLACAMEFARVIKDGLVVDYVGATRIVRRLVERLEGRLGRKLIHAAGAMPPGTGKKACATHRHVIEAAGLEVTAFPDEPMAANAVLGLRDGAVVDIGGGTTGLSVFKKGKVVYTADEPTGGTHLTLVLAGNYGISLDEAEKLKKRPERQKEIFPLVLPVLEKMGSIVARHLHGHMVPAVWLVGGTCLLPGMEAVITKEVGLPVFKPANPFLVTPLGIALHCGHEELP